MPFRTSPMLVALDAVRVVLVLAAALAAWRAVRLQRTGTARNPVPWAVLTILFIATTAMISVVP